MLPWDPFLWGDENTKLQVSKDKIKNYTILFSKLWHPSLYPSAPLRLFLWDFRGAGVGRMGGWSRGTTVVFFHFMNSNFCFWETGACFKAVKRRWGNLATWQVVKHFNQSGVLLKGLLNNFQQGGTSEKLIPHSMLYPLRGWYCVFFLYFGFYIHDSHINWKASFVNILCTYGSP